MKSKRLNNVIDIGSLDKRITLHKIVVTYDDYGSEIRLESISTAWANVKWKSSKESEDEGDLKGNYKISVAIRYISDITTKDKITYDSRKYDIINYKELGRKRFIILECESYG